MNDGINDIDRFFINGQRDDFFGGAKTGTLVSHF